MLFTQSRSAGVKRRAPPPSPQSGLASGQVPRAPVLGGTPRLPLFRLPFREGIWEPQMCVDGRHLRWEVARVTGLQRMGNGDCNATELGGNGFKGPVHIVKLASVLDTKPSWTQARESPLSGTSSIRELGLEVKRGKITISLQLHSLLRRGDPGRNGQDPPAPSPCAPERGLGGRVGDQDGQALCLPWTGGSAPHRAFRACPRASNASSTSGLIW